MIDYHDKEITGILFSKKERKIEIHFDDKGILSLDRVEYFEFLDFTVQNVIFEIRTTYGDEISEDLIDEFPALKFIRDKSERYKVYHLISSAGMYGVIVQVGS